METKITGEFFVCTSGSPPDMLWIGPAVSIFA